MNQTFLCLLWWPWVTLNNLEQKAMYQVLHLKMKWNKITHNLQPELKEDKNIFAYNQLIIIPRHDDSYVISSQSKMETDIHNLNILRHLIVFFTQITILIIWIIKSLKRKKGSIILHCMIGLPSQSLGRYWQNWTKLRPCTVNNTKLKQILNKTSHT